MPFDGIPPNKLLELTKLEEARDLLKRRRGWIQGALHYNNGTVRAYCLLGALGQVADNDGELLRSLVRRVFAEIGYTAQTTPWSSPSHAIAAYNDTRSRRKKDVIAVVDRAIAKALVKLAA